MACGTSHPWCAPVSGRQSDDRRSVMRRPVIGVLTAAATAVAAALVALPAHAAGAVLTAQIVQSSVWSSGYGADVTISNLGDAPSTGWTVAFDLPAGTTVSNSWSSTRTQSGQHYVFTSASYNGAIASGQHDGFGFNASG